MMVKMIVWDGKRKEVDVSEKACPTFKCFSLGQNKGPFTPGKGYTSYYKEPKWVCMTRHLHGCPTIIEKKEES